MDETTSTNLLLEPVEYKITETPMGVWRAHQSHSGQVFQEFTSHGKLFGMPLVHYTAGRCPETGRRKVARGIFAIGRVAVGVVAIGQASLGLVAIGQLALGVLFGLGQASSGLLCIGQLALAGIFGQMACGYVAIGQLGWGHYVLTQFGMGNHVIDMRDADPAALQFFRTLLP